NRLGSGKGYYDRFLAEIPRTVLRWGVIFESRISQTALPVEDFDEKVDLIISDEGRWPLV
ncbi:MAG: 5-formyltetrahydrofolate cyclo-ligase, partial [Verrucomicrobiales bacterium]